MVQRSCDLLGVEKMVCKPLATLCRIQLKFTMHMELNSQCSSNISQICESWVILWLNRSFPLPWGASLVVPSCLKT